MRVGGSLDAALQQKEAGSGLVVQQNTAVFVYNKDPRATLLVLVHGSVRFCMAATAGWSGLTGSCL
jgi:hypothetical protein